METVPHGIGVQNRYALFYDEDVDPLEILRQQEEEKQKRKTEKTQCKDKTKVTKSNKSPTSAQSQKKPVETTSSKTSKPIENTESAPKPKPRGPADRFQRNYASNQDSKDFEDRKNTRNREDQFSESKERDSEFRRGRGGPRGRGGRDRGRGFYGNAENKNRRMFDRHSGSDKTGVRPVDKREGAGSNNWGDIRTDISQGKDEVMWEEEFDGAADKTRETTWAEEDTNERKDETVKKESEDTKENEPVPEEPVEEAVKEMTLDEWKREQDAKRVVPKYNLRRPGEGEDGKQWKKSYMLKKKAKEEGDEQDEEDDEDDEEYNRKGNQRQLLDIQINFSDSRRGMRGRGRGGRGAPRAAGREPVREERGTRGGRAGNRERDPPRGKGQQSAPRVDDFNDFPSLANA